MAIETFKTCLDCKKNLTVSSFHKKGIYWDSRCKSCALVHKKQLYIIKKRKKVNCYNNIVIKTYHEEISGKCVDLISLLESFLLEECLYEPRVNA